MSGFNLKKVEDSKEKVVAKIVFLNKQLSRLKEREGELEKSIESLQEKENVFKKDFANEEGILKSKIVILKKEVSVLKEQREAISEEYSYTFQLLNSMKDALGEIKEKLPKAREEYEKIVSEKTSSAKDLSQLKNEIPLKKDELDRIEDGIEKEAKVLNSLKSEIEKVRLELNRLKELSLKEAVLLKEATESGVVHKNALASELEGNKEALREIREKINKANIEYKDNFALAEVQLDELREKKVKAFEGVKDIENREAELNKREIAFNLLSKELKMKFRMLKILMKKHEIEELL